MANVQILTTEKFDELKSSNGLILIDFWATWCPPCKVMSPIFDGLSEDEDLKSVQFFKCDVDEFGDIAQAFDVGSIPTFPLVKFNGDGSFDLEKDVLTKFVGAQDGLTFKTKLLEALKNVEAPLSSNDTTN